LFVNRFLVRICLPFVDHPQDTVTPCLASHSGSDGEGGFSFSRGAYRSCSPTFFFDTVGAKKKVRKKETQRTFRRLRAATKGAAFGNCKLLKKFDQNFAIDSAWSPKTQV
jgi:hypothetical protein